MTTVTAGVTPAGTGTPCLTSPDCCICSGTGGMELSPFSKAIGTRDWTHQCTLSPSLGIRHQSGCRVQMFLPPFPAQMAVGMGVAEQDRPAFPRKAQHKPAAWRRLSARRWSLLGGTSHSVGHWPSVGLFPVSPRPIFLSGGRVKSEQRNIQNSDGFFPSSPSSLKH